MIDSYFYFSTAKIIKKNKKNLRFYTYNPIILNNKACYANKQASYVNKMAPYYYRKAGCVGE